MVNMFMSFNDPLLWQIELRFFLKIQEKIFLKMSSQIYLHGYIYLSSNFPKP